MDAKPALALIAAAAEGRDVVLVGIGGHGAAGKSTLSHMIDGAQVVSTDEFWTGDGFDIERLGREVVDPLSEGLAATFASFDWAEGRPRGERTVTAEGVVIVEGVCALHRSLRGAYAVRIWVDAPYDVRLERAVARDGEAARAIWVEKWMPAEDRYVERDDPLSCAHLVLDNGWSVIPHPTGVSGGWPFTPRGVP